jgi:hypothetical protein
MIGMLGLLAACTAKLGVVSMFNLYFVPCECVTKCDVCGGCSSSFAVWWWIGCWVSVDQCGCHDPQQCVPAWLLALLAACTAKLGVTALCSTCSSSLVSVWWCAM